MSVTTIEKYSIKGFAAPQPIISEAQNEHYTEVLYKLERRGKLAAAEEKYAELLTVLIEAWLKMCRGKTFLPTRSAA